MLATESLWGILALGFSLGLLHAFDADHIMAVSGLSMQSTETPGRRLMVVRTARYCLRWALGHGGVLLAITIALIGFDRQLPAVVPALAERAVGLMLIALGVWIIVTTWRSRIGLRLHRHGDHVHMHLSADDNGRHDHRPVLLGMTHGLAGSAPFLALLPVLGTRSYTLAIAYMLLFCTGVVAAMLVFGFCLGHVQSALARLGTRVLHGSRLLLGAASVGFGIYWLAG